MRIGVVGPVGLDRFAENVCDALVRMGHVVTTLGPALVGHRSQLTTRLTAVARQALPRIDERVQGRIVRSALAARCEVVINLDARLMPGAVAKLRRGGVRIAL